MVLSSCRASPMLRDTNFCGTSKQVCPAGTTCQDNECKIPLGNQCGAGITKTCGKYYGNPDSPSSAAGPVDLVCKPCTGAGCPAASSSTCQLPASTVGSPCISFTAPCSTSSTACIGATAYNPGVCKGVAPNAPCTTNDDCYTTPGDPDSFMLRCGGDKKCARLPGQLGDVCYKTDNCDGSFTGKSVCSGVDKEGDVGTCKKGIGMPCDQGSECFACKSVKNQSECCATVPGSGYDGKVCVLRPTSGSHQGEPCTSTAMCENPAPVGPGGADVAMMCDPQTHTCTIDADADAPVAARTGAGWKWTNVATVLIVAVALLLALVLFYALRPKYKKSV